MPAPKSYWVYIGNYSPVNGIYLFRLDSSTSTLTHAANQPVIAAENPNFLALHPSGKFLYAVTSATVDNNRGAVEAFAIDRATGTLTFLNRVSSGAAEPVHVAIDPAGKVAVVANYSGAAVSSFTIAADGRLQPAASIIKHVGSSVDPARQKQPYPHGSVFDPAGDRVLVADLGLDQVFVYNVNRNDATLTANSTASVTPGSGPRHMAFGTSPAGENFLYLVNEMGNTLTVFSYSADGVLTEIQTLAPWPSATRGKDTAAEVWVHPHGRFLYASDRGLDSIARLALAPDSGKLTVFTHTSTGGNGPRHFALDPAGDFLIAANQNSDSLVLFKIDPAAATLTQLQSIPTPKPVCVVFLPTVTR